jgi:superoxide dismutase, Cu-Zn family
MRIFIAATALMLSACAATPTPETASDGKSVFARLYAFENGALVPYGQAQLVDQTGGIRLDLDLEGRPANLSGEVGVHLHGIGKCDGPDFVSAGPHWNPESKQHGLNNPMGHHAGDMPNINVRFGEKTRELRDIKGGSIAALMDADGAAIVIHEKPDDNISDPSGNSGKRIICGVFTEK